MISLLINRPVLMADLTIGSSHHVGDLMAILCYSRVVPNKIELRGSSPHWFVILVEEVIVRKMEGSISRVDG